MAVWTTETTQATVGTDSTVKAVGKVHGGTTSVARFTLFLPAVFEQEGEWIVASFPDLDLSSQGHTRDEAARNLIEAAQSFIEDCFARNVLDEVLKECGFSIAHQARPTPPASEYLTRPC